MNLIKDRTLRHVSSMQSSAVVFLQGEREREAAELRERRARACLSTLLLSRSIIVLQVEAREGES